MHRSPPRAARFVRMVAPWSTFPFHPGGRPTGGRPSGLEAHATNPAASFANRPTTDSASSREKREARGEKPGGWPEAGAACQVFRRTPGRACRSQSTEDSVLSQFAAIRRFALVAWAELVAPAGMRAR
jgi:hypothetical protein